MPDTGASGSMSGDGKRSHPGWSRQARSSSILPNAPAAMPADGPATPAGRIVRLTAVRESVLHITVDGCPTAAQAGDSVLVAVLAAGPCLRYSEFTGEPRAGFCLMGACQDCWMWTEDGRRIRACTTRVWDGLAVMTRPTSGWAAEPHDKGA
jgi:D-hydroxyproline dehydrogenase subunit gamma